MHNKIAVIGDIIIDVDKYLKDIGVSLETPNIKGTLTNTYTRIGGAGNIISSMNEFGYKPYLFSIVGEDYSDYIFSKLKFTNHVDIIKNSKSTIKTRYWSNNYKLLQVNQDLKVSDQHIKKFLKNTIETIYKKNINKIIISDYAKIFNSLSINKFFYEELFKYNKSKDLELYVDSQYSSSFRNINFYHSSYYLLNLKEFNAICNFYNLKKSLSKKVFRKIFINLNIKNKLIVKLGKDGALSFDGKSIFKNKIKNSKPIRDVSGAGDYFLSAYAIHSSKNEIDRLKIANKFALKKIL